MKDNGENEYKSYNYNSILVVIVIAAKTDCFHLTVDAYIFIWRLIVKSGSFQQIN